MSEILASASIIAGFVLAISSAIKTQIKDTKRLPIINIVIGIFIGAVYALSFQSDQLVLFIWAGLIAGLAAGGFYDLGKGILPNSHNKGEEDNDSI
ncbi:hypothetical protein JZO77_05520 [Enterococcus hulanensis]|uniref:holin n=1 Tax=Enterococcus hulanensis TaxID=2559929 RepID=UPI001A905280|nr:holin [Enterococcus hulanensis]MBO0456199.1 hypothetical protein [Enterococcus hulanensis]